MAVVFDEMFEIVFRGEADFKIPLIRSVFHRQVFRQTVDSSVLQNYSRRRWPCQLGASEVVELVEAGLKKIQTAYLNTGGTVSIMRAPIRFLRCFADAYRAAIHVEESNGCR